VTTVAAVTERRSVTIWVPLARVRIMVIASRITFGVLSRRAVTTSVAIILTARTLTLPLTRSLPVASGVGNLFLFITVDLLNKLSAVMRTSKYK